jgi:hypothetical protein
MSVVIKSPRAGGVLLLMLLAIAAGLARAQTQPAESDAAKDLVGGWEISNSDHDKRCAVSFSLDAAASGGRKLTLDPGCSGTFPEFKDVAAWTLGPKDEVQLIDASGNSIIEFAAVESGMYEGHREGEGLFFMQAQAALKAEVHSADQMFGEWKLLRELDKPLCALTLSNAVDGEGGYKLVVKPGCSNAIRGFGLSTWRLDGDQLVLAGRTGIWRFSESDPSAWERIPLSTDPLLLMRQ